MSTDTTPPDTISLEAAKKLVDKTLEDFFATRIEKADTMHAAYTDLWKTASTLSRSGGKRLRPYVALLTYESVSGKPASDIISVASSLELLHLGMLVHDDIIDRDSIRYGVLNISGSYNETYKEFIPDARERQHFSDSAALMAGDLLLLGGHDLILEGRLSDGQLRIASNIYNDAAFVVAGGELLDTEASFRPPEAIDATTVGRLKTAHYSFITPLLMGACLGGASEKTCQQLQEFGENLGIGYQLVDDLLGVFGAESVTRKSTMNDLREGKKTFLVEQFELLATSEQRATFEQLFGKKTLSHSEADILRDLLIESGAKKSVETSITMYKNKALQILERLVMDSAHRLAFEKLVLQALDRVF